MELTPRVAGTVGLLALVPALVYTFDLGDVWAAITLVNVLLIVASLYIAFSPIGEDTSGTSRMAG